MQTWLPFPDFRESAGVLDSGSLSLQIDHTLAVLDVLHDADTSGFKGAPDRLVNMWRGHEPQLAEYGMALIEECGTREVKTPNKAEKNMLWHLDCATSGEFNMDKPKWFGDIDLHKSHQAGLVRFKPEFYRDKFDVDRTLKMLWPVA